MIAKNSRGPHVWTWRAGGDEQSCLTVSLGPGAGDRSELLGLVAWQRYLIAQLTADRRRLAALLATYAVELERRAS